MAARINVRDEPRTFVVMTARIGGTNLWAWCEIGEGPGFVSMFFTHTDGMTPFVGEGVPQLTDYLFTVTETLND
jgi:hypothetical protein